MALVSRESEVTTVRDLVDRMAVEQLDAPFAIGAETGRVLTFKGLQEGARAISGRLLNKGLKKADKVAFLMDNGLFTVQVFLGAMYGGFITVPLNARAGVTQIAYSLEHCDARVVFVSDRYRELAREALAKVERPIEVLSADTDEIAEPDGFDHDILHPVSSEDPALLMYTSGSMGQPKGAVHTHKSVLSHGRNSIRAHELTAADRSLLVLPLYHINGECVTLMPTLMSGGSLVVPHGFSINEFWDLLEKHSCTWSAIVPTIVSQILDWQDPKAASRGKLFAGIRFLRTSSGPLSPSIHREFLAKFPVRLLQAMGSTEAGNVFSNPQVPGKNKVGSPGLPWGFETKVVDRNGAEVRAGEPGEILLRGDGMAACYYKDPSGAAAAFDREGWLHTGDLAFQDEDGYFFIVGRSKELIIKGGMNIAPKQIDEALEAHPGVLEAAALGIPDRYLGEDIVAFVAPRTTARLDEGELLSFCESSLGHFKTPTRIHIVDSLPKGPSGKVQRLRLLTMATEAAGGGGDGDTVGKWGSELTTSPGWDDEASIEPIISGVWAKLLGVPTVGLNDNFFSLGGYSLLAIQCLSELREKLSMVLSLSDFFENATVADLTALVRARRRTRSSGFQARQEVDVASVSDVIPPRDRSASCALSPNQQRIWFMEQLNPGVPVYNEAEAVRLYGDLDVGLLRMALDIIVSRHEILRTTINADGDDPLEDVHENWPLKLKQIDLMALPAEQRQAELSRLLVEEPRVAYTLDREPGVRVTLIRMNRADHVLILMMHHLICDWSSVGVIWRELSALYRAGRAGAPMELPVLRIQHGDYSAWRRQRQQRADFKEDLAYWEENLRSAPALLDLPADRPRPSVMSYRGARERFLIPNYLTSTARASSRVEKVSLFVFVTAALNALIYRYTAQEDILLGIPLADRDRPDLESVIGFLLHTHVLRTKLSGDLTFRSLLGRTQKSVLDLYAHRVAPFDQVVNRVKPSRSASYSPLFQVMLNWRDRDQQLTYIGMDGLQVESLLAESATSKFDMTFMFTDGGDELWLEVEYNTDLYDRDRIARMFGHLCTLLEGAADRPETELDSLPLLTTLEQSRLLEQWNAVSVDETC